MIDLHPVPRTNAKCPYCAVSLDAVGWLIPGMRMLADLRCSQCARAFYTDLPAGHGLLYPALLEQGNARLHSTPNWFGQSLAHSYQARTSVRVALVEEEIRPVRRPVLLNCLDSFYGHGLLKLLNAQYYIDHCPERDLIVMVPTWLRWLVPDGAAAIWTIDLPLRRGAEWNDALAEEIARRLTRYEDVRLSVAFGCPHPSEVSITRFTQVAPFDVQTWQQSRPPVVTFVWREDRFWTKRRPFAQRVVQKLTGRPRPLAKQAQQIKTLGALLKRKFPALDFAVAGLGKSGTFPSWIQDLRTERVDAKQETAWCERYAQSHLVVGVHGSNMLLPSAHAGCTLTLTPPDRWGNQFQDVLISSADVRDALCRYHALPLETTPAAVAALAASLLQELPLMRLNFLRPWNEHDFVQGHPFALAERRAQIVETLPE